jgi:hypothetical protein
MSENITVQQVTNDVTIQQSINQVTVGTPGIQGAPGNFVYIYNVDGGTPTSIYGGNIIIDAGGVS